MSACTVWAPNPDGTCVWCHLGLHQGDHELMPCADCNGRGTVPNLRWHESAPIQVVGALACPNNCAKGLVRIGADA